MQGEATIRDVISATCRVKKHFKLWKKLQLRSNSSARRFLPANSWSSPPSPTSGSRLGGWKEAAASAGSVSAAGRSRSGFYWSFRDWVLFWVTDAGCYEKISACPLYELRKSFYGTRHHGFLTIISCYSTQSTLIVYVFGWDSAHQ